MNKIPFFLVTGFLGSGKTTLLKRMLDTHADHMRIGVVQNEFAPGNVDGNDIRISGKPFEILEINNGSVFCVCLLSEFISSLQQFVNELKPDAVILEASGLSDPIAIAQLLAAPNLKDTLYLAYIWTVVDASSAVTLLPTMTRMQHQVRVADTVIINKVDKVTGALDKIRERIATLNPFAQVVQTSYCDIDCIDMFADRDTGPLAIEHTVENAAFESCGRPDIQSAVLRTTRCIPRVALESFLSDCAPRVIRLKGFVNLDDGSAVAVQSCFGETTIRTIQSYSGPTELVAMGDTLAQDQFSMDFSSYAELTRQDA